MKQSVVNLKMAELVESGSKSIKKYWEKQFRLSMTCIAWKPKAESSLIMNKISVVGWRLLITTLYGLSSLFWKEWWWWGTSFSLRYLTTDLYEFELNACNFRPLVEALHSKREFLVSSLILTINSMKFSSDSINIGGGFGGLVTVDVWLFAGNHG